MNEEQKCKTLRCNTCKEFFSFVEGFPPKACPDCMAKREAQTQRLRDLIRDNRGINAMELSQRTNIPIEHVMQALNEGEVTIRQTDETFEQLGASEEVKRINHGKNSKFWFKNNAHWKPNKL